MVMREDVIDVIRSAKVVSDPENLRDEVRLSDQGIDSLGIFNVLLVLSEKYDIEIPDADIDHLATISQMVGYINRRLN